MKIILASKSPRRKDLLRQAGLKFFIRPPEVAETYPAHLSVSKVPIHIARKKAEAVFPSIKKDELILAADTIVIVNKKMLGKPKNYKDAVRMLKLLSRKKHLVITGVCLLSRQKEKTFSVTTAVHFRKLTGEQIDFYLKKFKPFDKAGAYAIQEWMGLVGIEKIEGDYFNVVGLPVGRVIEEMQKF